MKLSELLAEKGITLDDLVDDELNLPVSEVRKRLKANQDGFTKATQTLAEKDRALQQYAEAYEQWRQYGEGLASRAQTLEQQAAARAEQVQREGGDWRRDPLFADLVSDHDKLSAGIRESHDNSSALAKGIVGIAQRYNADRGAFLGFADEVTRRFMKMDHPDFDADEVRAWAKENGVADSWKNSYDRMKASKFPEQEEKIRKDEREKVLTEHGDRLKDPPATEMGGSARPSGPAGGPRQKEYKDAWGGLAGELEKAGLART
jgi:hypothetical protein